MRTMSFLLCAVLLSAGVAEAKPKKVWTKKFMVFAAVLAGAAFADGIHAVHMQRRGLVETNPLYGSHPSTPRIFLEGSAIIAGEIGLVALLKRKAELGDKFILPVFAAQSAIHICAASGLRHGFPCTFP